MNDLEKEIESTSLLVDELQNDLKKATSRLKMLKASTQPTISEILKDFDKYFSVSKKKKRHTVLQHEDIMGIVCEVRALGNTYISLEQEKFLRTYVRHFYQDDHVEFILNQKQ